jgi:site-specific recombinase XerD
MEVRTTFTILFWLAKSRMKHGKAPISCRITVNGERTELSTQREVSVLEWDPKSQKVSGRSQEAKDINNHLAIIKSKLLACQTKIEARGENISAEAIKNEYIGKKRERRGVLEAFAFWLERLDDQVKKHKRSIATYNKYVDTKNHLGNFILHQYKVKDLYMDEVTYAFIADFEFYLSVTKKLANNTAMKYVSLTKSIFKMAQQRGWMSTNPVVSFSCSFEWNDPLRLELHELEAIWQKEMPVCRLEEARDTYVFMCYTGFAFIDAFNLNQDNIFWGIDKQQWIARDRQKTDGTECIPLLDIPLQIIEKYKDHPYCVNKGKLLPIRSNQNFNGYLKEIAAICGINKELTTHTARHTFATSVTLENDVPLETVGKMLGHKSIKSTQRYAQVTRKKILNNMNELRTKLVAIQGIEQKTGS